MPKISVVISAFNEEKVIKDCLESVHDLADEIVFINNSSEDKTAQIVQKYTQKIFMVPNDPINLNRNKNFGFEKASGDWILSLDADERIPKELANEIKKVTKKTEFSGFNIPRKNIIFGKWMKHSGWYPDHQLRLFKKGEGHFPEEHVHEKVEVRGRIGQLRNDFLHHHYTSVSQFIQKMDKTYSTNEAQALIKTGKKLSWKDAIRMPAQEFLRRYFAREAYKDGFHGLVLSLLMAFYHLEVFAKVWEAQGFWEDNDQKPESVLKEFSRFLKEVRYWVLTSLIKESFGVKRIFLRIRRKFYEGKRDSS